MRESYRLLKIGVLAMLVLACALPFSLNLVDPDLWGHVQYAKDWMAAGSMPRTATHTYSAAGYPWVNHEIVAEFALALGVEHLGIYVMLVMKCLLGLAIVATMAQYRATAWRAGAERVGAARAGERESSGIFSVAAAALELCVVHARAGLSGSGV